MYINLYKCIYYYYFIINLSNTMSINNTRTLLSNKFIGFCKNCTSYNIFAIMVGHCNGTYACPSCFFQVIEMVLNEFVEKNEFPIPNTFNEQGYPLEQWSFYFSRYKTNKLTKCRFSNFTLEPNCGIAVGKKNTSCDQLLIPVYYSDLHPEYDPVLYHSSTSHKSIPLRDIFLHTPRLYDTFRSCKNFFNADDEKFMIGWDKLPKKLTQMVDIEWEASNVARMNVN